MGAGVHRHLAAIGDRKLEKSVTGIVERQQVHGAVLRRVQQAEHGQEDAVGLGQPRRQPAEGADGRHDVAGGADAFEIGRRAFAGQESCVPEARPQIAQIRRILQLAEEDGAQAGIGHQRGIEIRRDQNVVGMMAVQYVALPDVDQEFAGSGRFEACAGGKNIRVGLRRQQILHPLAVGLDHGALQCAAGERARKPVQRHGLGGDCFAGGEVTGDRGVLDAPGRQVHVGEPDVTDAHGQGLGDGELDHLVAQIPHRADVDDRQCAGRLQGGRGSVGRMGFGGGMGLGGGRGLLV